MAPSVLILDAEALSALAFPAERAAAAARARAVMQVAHDHGALVRVPAPVLAEVCRGRARDAAVERLLASGAFAVVDLTADLARRAGKLLERSGLGSEHAIDAFVIATASALAPCIVATHDPLDLRRLASRERGVRIWPI